MRLGATFIFVTHDQGRRIDHGRSHRRAQSGADRAGRHARRKYYTNPATPSSASFVGSPAINLIRAGLPAQCRRFAGGFSSCRCRQGGAGEGPTPLACGPRTSKSRRELRSRPRSRYENHGIENNTRCASATQFVRAAVPAVSPSPSRRCRPVRMEFRQGYLLRCEIGKEPRLQGRLKRTGGVALSSEERHGVPATTIRNSQRDLAGRGARAAPDSEPIIPLDTLLKLPAGAEADGQKSTASISGWPIRISRSTAIATRSSASPTTSPASG